MEILKDSESSPLACYESNFPYRQSSTNDSEPVFSRPIAEALHFCQLRAESTLVHFLPQKNQRVGPQRISLFIVLCSLLAVHCSSGGSPGAEPELRHEACNLIGSQPRIIRGSECEAKNSPIVKLLIDTGPDSVALCSGTMLTNNQLLTAAHCFLSDSVGATYVEINGEKIFASHVALHPDVHFDDAVYNDVAVVTLTKAIETRTLPLLLSNPVEADAPIGVFGYGLDENGLAEVLRSGEMQVTDVTSDHISCRFEGEEGSNTCNGDSGGPALFTVEKDGLPVTGIVGITSTGSKTDCQAGDLSLFINIQNPSISSFILTAAPGAQVE